MTFRSPENEPINMLSAPLCSLVKNYILKLKLEIGKIGYTFKTLKRLDL